MQQSISLITGKKFPLKSYKINAKLTKLFMIETAGI